MSDLHEAKIQVVGISPDEVKILKAFTDQKSIEFPLLADTDSKLIKSLGIHNQGGLPHPGTIIVDREGIVQAKIFIEGFRERHPVSQLLEEIERLKSAARE